jgi:hypothetical protein
MNDGNALLTDALMRIAPVCHRQQGPVVHIFTANYNVFRIMSGMGGLAFSGGPIGPVIPVNREDITSIRDLGKFEYVFQEKESQTDASKYEYNVG